MSNSKFYDTAAAMQVIGCVFNNPNLLVDTGQYTLTSQDFTNSFHKVVIGAINNLVVSGAQNISVNTVEDYLRPRENSYATYKANNGGEWLLKVFSEADLGNFEYYYNRVKKMTLLRTYESIGVNVDWIYDPDSLDVEEREQQNNTLDELPLEEIADMIDNRVLRVREIVVDDSTDESCHLGDSVDELLQKLEDSPIRGNPLSDNVNDYIAMGARLGTFYLRSAPTGAGKSRSAMADACNLACDSIYNPKTDTWDWNNGDSLPTLFISVELDKEELQTMALAYIGGVPENHILDTSLLDFKEEERLKKAVGILKRSKLYIEYLPDYSMRDIENCIKRNLRVNKVQYIFMDYVTSSMSMIQEIANATRGMNMREDQMLFQLSSKLKDLATKYHVFIFSSTQINGQFKTEKIPDQTLLSGAKAIANRIDFGEILLDLTPEDKAELADKGDFLEKYGDVNMKCSVYKNRRGKYNRILLWVYADKGTCRYETRFITDYMFNDLTPQITEEMKKIKEKQEQEG